jgi:drug/metabolite transporter (DMT)-like permease
MNKTSLGYLLVLIGATLTGTIGVMGKLIYAYESSPLTVITFRATFAFLFIAFVLVVFRPSLSRINLTDLPYFALYGFLSIALSFMFFFSSIKYTTVATATILLYTFPAIVVLLSALILNEKITRYKIVALILTFLGTALVIQVYNTTKFNLNLKGALFGLGAALGAASYTILGKRAVKKYDPLTIVFYAFGFGSLFLLLFRGPKTILQVDYPILAWVWILILALISTLLGYFLYTKGLQYIEAGKAGITAVWEVAVASVLAFIVLGEVLTLPQITGGILIILGIFVIRRG